MFLNLTYEAGTHPSFFELLVFLTSHQPVLSFDKISTSSPLTRASSVSSSGVKLSETYLTIKIFFLIILIVHSNKIHFTLSRRNGSAEPIQF
jgi:hypothetical protein